MVRISNLAEPQFIEQPGISGILYCTVCTIQNHAEIFLVWCANISREYYNNTISRYYYMSPGRLNLGDKYGVTA